MCAQDQRKDIRIKSSNFAKKDNLQFTFWNRKCLVSNFIQRNSNLKLHSMPFSGMPLSFALLSSGSFHVPGNIWPHQKKSFECGKCKNLFSPKYYEELMKKVKSDMYIRLSPIINEAAILMLSQKYLHNIMILRFFSNFPVSNVHFI